MSASCYSLIKALVLNAIFVSLCIPTNAQTQRYTMSEKFNKGIEVSNTITLYIPGTLKYSYKHSGDSDKKIKDGPLTINCHISSLSDGFISVHRLKNGRYSVRANFKEDQLNGPYSAQLSYTLVHVIYDSWGDEALRSTDIVSQSITCSFKDAKPHGRFLMKVTGRGTISATFNNGKITGPFSIFGGTGNISPSGKPIGRWEMDEIYTFQNGVLISKSNHTDSYESSLARKYATKQISKEGLSEYGYFIRIDSIDLGKELWEGICDCDLFDFNKPKNNTNNTKGYDFSTPNVVKYECLEKKCVFTDKGFDKFCQIIQDAELTGNPNTYKERLDFDYRYGPNEIGFYTHRIMLNDNLTISDLVLEDTTHTYENTYITYSDESWAKDDYIGELKPYSHFWGIYLKYSQFQKLKSMTDFAQEEKEYKDEQQNIYTHRSIEYSDIKTKPKFTQDNIYYWLLKNIRCKDISASECEKLKDRFIIVHFIIEKDGSIEYAVISKFTDPSLDRNDILDAEAVNTILRMPKWTPGRDEYNNVVRFACDIYIPCMMFMQQYHEYLMMSYKTLPIRIY